MLRKAWGQVVLSGVCWLASLTELVKSGSVKDPVSKDRDGASETASRVKAPYAKADRLSFILGTHTEKGEHARAHTHTQICKGKTT